MGKVVQNQQPGFEDIKPVIDGNIVDTVYGILETVTKLNPLDSIFEDLGNRFINDLKANDFFDIKLELTKDQQEHLIKIVKQQGHETVRNYLSSLDTDERTKEIYGIVREKTTAIADAVLSSIGQEINRGAIINCYAVQANSKNKDHDEILLRKSKSSGDVTIPTNGIFLSSNCVELIKASCQEEMPLEPEWDGEEAADGDSIEKAAADKPKRVGKGKK